MTTAPLPDRPTAPSRSRWPLIVSGVVVVALAIAVVASFLGGSSTDRVDRLDPTISAPPGDLSPGVDPTGTKVAGLTYATFDGGQRRLAAEGKPLLVNFWASTCAPCVAEMPALDAFARDNADRVSVLGLDYGETPEMGRSMLERVGVTYPVGRDPKGTLLAAFGGRGLPYTVLIGADGTVLAAHSGAMDQTQMTALLDTATARR